MIDLTKEIKGRNCSWQKCQFCVVGNLEKTRMAKNFQIVNF